MSAASLLSLCHAHAQDAVAVAAELRARLDVVAWGLAAVSLVNLLQGAIIVRARRRLADRERQARAEESG